MSLRSIVWSIAGSDSSGAAGLQADLKTMNCLGVHGASVVTAITAQNLTDADVVQVTGAEIVERQLRALERQMSPAAVKIGMLGSGEVVRVIASFFENKRIPLVLDPVFRATAGASLLDADGVEVLCKRLLPLATVFTPNIPEAEKLTGLVICSPSDMERAAIKLRSFGASTVVIKGGHFAGEHASDYVLDACGGFWLRANRSQNSVRGTGCSFASAVAAAMSLGQDPRNALVVAKAYVTRGMREGEIFSEGSSGLFHHGPWPVTADCFPTVYCSQNGSRSYPPFPLIDSDSLGFYPIVPRASWVEPLADLGVKTIQLRVKDLDGQSLVDEIRKAVRISKQKNINLFINDYWQAAIQEGAYGAHLGQEDLETADIEAIHASGMRLGISTHSYIEAAVAHGIRPSYVALGPIFRTTCKSMEFGPQGIARLREWKSLLPYPLVAIGGLKPEHIPLIKAAQGDAAAVISDWLDNKTPLIRAMQWLTNWNVPHSVESSNINKTSYQEHSLE